MVIYSISIAFCACRGSQSNVYTVSVAELLHIFRVLSFSTKFLWLSNFCLDVTLKCNGDGVGLSWPLTKGFPGSKTVVSRGMMHAEDGDFVHSCVVSFSFKSWQTFLWQQFHIVSSNQFIIVTDAAVPLHHHFCSAFVIRCSSFMTVWIWLNFTLECNGNGRSLYFNLLEMNVVAGQWQFQRKMKSAVMWGIHARWCHQVSL